MPTHMLIHVRVSNGRVENLFDSNNAGENLGEAEDGSDILVDPPTGKRKIKDNLAVPHLMAQTNPTCRYVQTASGWKKVCT